MLRLFILLISLSLFASSCGNRKPSKPRYPDNANRKSPIAIASLKEGNTYIKIVYGQPYRNGRTIFGDWEPYGEVWRTGANEATEITLTQPVLLANEQIDAGSYSLFSIPGEEEWTIILNYELGLWGAFDYKQSKDYKRFTVPVNTLVDPVEVFTIEFDEAINEISTLRMEWDRVRIEIPLRVFNAD
jgi:hypothetical protein